MAYSDDGVNFKELNKNYGILFATATISSNNTINEKGLKKPYIFYTAEGAFGIIAIRVIWDGSIDEESKGKVLVWTSEDLVNFEEIGLIDLKKDAYVEEVTCEYEVAAGIILFGG